MKSICIHGKRNIDSIGGEKKAIRSGMEYVTDEHTSHVNQLAMINKLYMGYDFEYKTTLKKELVTKVKISKREFTMRKNLYLLKIQLKNLYRQSYYATTVL